MSHEYFNWDDDCCCGHYYDDECGNNIFRGYKFPKYDDLKNGDLFFQKPTDAMYIYDHCKWVKIFPNSVEPQSFRWGVEDQGSVVKAKSWSGAPTLGDDPTFILFSGPTGPASVGLDFTLIESTGTSMVIDEIPPSQFNNPVGPFQPLTLELNNVWGGVTGSTVEQVGNDEIRAENRTPDDLFIAVGMQVFATVSPAVWHFRLTNATKEGNIQMAGVRVFGEPPLL